MYIERILLKNYRAHALLDLRFRPGMTVVAGVNGAGKTSLLHGIFEALTPAAPNLPGLALPTSFGEAGFAHVKAAAPNGRVRFEEQYPVQLDVVVEAYGSLRTWSVVRSLTQHQVLGEAGNGILQDRMLEAAKSIDTAEPQSLAVLAFYRADRAWWSGDANVLAAAIERSSRGHGYDNWGHAGQRSEAVERWIVAKSLERLQVASETGQQFSQVVGDELEQVIRALHAALPAFQSIYYDFTSKRILVDWRGDDIEPAERIELVAFEHLSAGQRAVICLIADIARRMCLLNPHLGDEVTSQTEGIVLIDEIDMHLHPAWQRALTRGLVKAFPKVQFIVASHSPQVIGEISHENVILLTPEGPVNPQGSFGMTSNQVLQELMEAEVRATPVRERLAEIDEALARNQLDEAERKIQSLSKDAPELRELAGAEALLKRKRVLGR
ncbi:AAA family ATPase [Roseateles sp. MS654]|uniref:AAA family ATPase n=1 Tax=Roseateles sp. MS654 TaxID=3412685 RepID=UPI003C2F17A4